MLKISIRILVIFLHLVLVFIHESFPKHWIVKTLPITFTSPFQPNNIKQICSLISEESSKEKNLCLTYPNMMVSIVYGAKLGLVECAQQFKYERWNCTFNKSFPKIMTNHLHEMTTRSVKETAFLFSIWSSGVVYSITNSCSKGDLKECYCDPQRHGQDKDNVGDFTWGGCSDHIKFGMKVSTIFLDNYDRKDQTGQALMNQHNNRVGRRVVWKTRLKKCKCHGVSGACSLRTCWQRMNDFRRIGDMLKKLYNKPQKVTYNPFQKSLTFSKNRFRRPSKKKLVYIDNSQDYCIQDPSIGHPGTGGRECNYTSSQHDSCQELCCHRGHLTYEMVVEENCDCKFFWCCEVRCKICRRKVFVYRCKHLE
uniref:Protein Wnt n=2 Tax=Schmidtea mediterranea TaxID=79327 RepID=D2D4A7_SCHMD|nr:Wnt2-1 [Schmidtea mediterranea]